MAHSGINILSLCAGIGGIDIGCKLAMPDARTVCYVENEAQAIRVLEKRIREKDLDAAPIWDDLRSFDGVPWRGMVDCVIGGYPCTPFSVAGKRKGTDDERHLWGEMHRVMRETQPQWGFFENVGAHLRLGFDAVYNDLRGLGYSVKAGIFFADEVGAPHRRERLFILAHRIGKRQSKGRNQPREDAKTGHHHYFKRPEPCLFCEPVNVANPDGERKKWRKKPSNSKKQTHQDVKRPVPHIYSKSVKLGDPDNDGAFADSLTGANKEKSNARRQKEQEASGQFEGASGIFPPGIDGDWHKIHADLKPEVCRVAYGDSNRLDRLQTIGNAVVPLVAAYAITFLGNVGKGE